MFTVRIARLEDAEAVVAVHERASAELFEETVGAPLADVLPLEGRLAECRALLLSAEPAAPQSRTRTLVAERDGEIVGMTTWSLDPDDAGEVVDLHVVPDAWGTGVAASLLDAAVAGLRDAGAREPFLWVGEVNARARRFYEREGWEHDGTARASRLGPTVLRYRLLSKPDRSST